MTAEGTAGGADLDPDEAFGLLGNDTRVGILQALWDGFNSGVSDNAMPYSELFDQVEIADSGNFSYHLEKLTGPFVRRTDDGYELTQSGINVVRAVVAGTVTAGAQFERTTIDVACPVCEAPVELAYANELMTVRCPRCVGVRQWAQEPGFLFAGLVPPAGIGNRPIEEAFRAAIVFTQYQIAALQDGACPHCACAPVKTVDVCPDHRPGERRLCPACGWKHMAEVWLVCSTCKRSVFPPAKLVILNEPQVTAFYADHGITHRFASWGAIERSTSVREELLSVDPLKLRLVTPGLVDTEKVATLGWDSTPHPEAIARTVEEHVESDRIGRHLGPDRAVERRAIENLTG